MQQFEAAVPFLTVRDVDASAAWYRDVLGFDVGLMPAQPPAAYASLRRDGVEIMLGRCAYRRFRPKWTSAGWDPDGHVLAIASRIEVAAAQSPSD